MASGYLEDSEDFLLLSSRHHQDCPRYLGLEEEEAAEEEVAEEEVAEEVEVVEEEEEEVEEEEEEVGTAMALRTASNTPRIYAR